MDKLMEYICDELEELEKKAGKGSKLSMTEIEYLDKLAHIKKNILKAEEMWGESEYADDGGSYAKGRNYMIGGSYASGRGSNAKRDSMGRYSSRGNSYRMNSYENGYSGKEDIAMQLQELEQSAPDEETRRMIGKWMRQLEQR